MGDLLAKVSLGGLLHPDEDHGRDLLGGKVLELALVLDLDHRLSALVNNLEGPVLHVALDVPVCERATDETLSVKDSVLRVLRRLVLGRLTDEALLVGERDPGRSDTVSLALSATFLSSFLEADLQASLR